MPDFKQFKLPDVGEGLTEAEIVTWHIKPGDQVTLNQTIVEIETAKAAVELPCPYDGQIYEVLVAEGETVDVGTPIITIDLDPSGEAPGGGSSAGTEQAGQAEEAVGTPPAEGAVEPGVHGSPAPAASTGEGGGERQPVLVGYGVKTSQAKRRPRKSQPATGVPNGTAAGAGSTGAPPGTSGGATTATPPNASPSGVPDQGRTGGSAVLAKPPVRKMAKDLGIDLARVPASGPNGTITRADVEAAASGTPQAPAAPAFDASREQRIPIRGVRKHTAAAMVSSAFTAPHVTEFLTIDVTETVDAVERIQALPDFAELRVSPLLLVVKALLLAARRHPMVNATWDEQAQEIVVKEYVNLGIAAATERGLVVPNIKEAQAKTLPELGQALRDLVKQARDGKTAPADMQGGTITITNVGVFGVDTGTPILNPGESAILAFGQIRDMPWVHEGQVVPRKVTTLAMSFDHRVIDGELGSKVLRDIGTMLESPTAMLAWS